MNAPQAIAQYRALYGRNSVQLIAELIEAGDAFTAALQTLRANPTPDGAEILAIQLSGMQRAAYQISLTLSREQGK